MTDTEDSEWRRVQLRHGLRQGTADGKAGEQHPGDTESIAAAVDITELGEADG